MKQIFLVFLLTLSGTALAEVYRWTDSNGKVHFSDKKPAEVKAEDISEKVKQQNIDTSTAERQKLETIFRKENEADRAYKMQQDQKPIADIQKCQEAREYLKIVEGRVRFFDEDGRAVKVTEAERIKRAQEARDYVEENCSD